MKHQIFDNPIRYNSLGDLLLAIVDGIVILLIPIMVFSIVWLGFQMVLTLYSGNAEKYSEYKKSLTYAFLGLFIVLSAKGILFVIKNTVDQVLV